MHRLNDLYYIDLDTWEWHEMQVPNLSCVSVKMPKICLVCWRFLLCKPKDLIFILFTVSFSNIAEQQHMSFLVGLCSDNKKKVCVLLQECPPARPRGTILAFLHTRVIRSHLSIWRLHHRKGDAQWVRLLRSFTGKRSPEPVSTETLLFCFPGDAWLYCVSKNEWRPFKHNHTESPRSLSPLFMAFYWLVFL